MLVTKDKVPLNTNIIQVLGHSIIEIVIHILCSFLDPW
jgi:hypothetical protein